MGSGALEALPRSDGDAPRSVGAWLGGFSGAERPYFTKYPAMEELRDEISRIYCALFFLFPFLPLFTFSSSRLPSFFLLDVAKVATLSPFQDPRGSNY